jgi:hypothetical protein
VTLPPDIGSKRGSSQTLKRRFPKVFLRLSNSAIPEVNGESSGERSPGTGMDLATPGVVADVAVNTLGWDGQGVLEIIQELPLRTEVLAVFGTAQNNEV